MNGEGESRVRALQMGVREGEKTIRQRERERERERVKRDSRAQ